LRRQNIWEFQRQNETFSFTKNRPKPGSVKEKFTEYFREQRALLLEKKKD
jgi:hypothetical protein